MKLRSIIILLVFLNFTALPGIAAVLGWDLPQTNVVINEEENHSHGIVLYEKTLPRTLDVHDFIKFFEEDLHKKNFTDWSDNTTCHPYLSILSPPPEM